MKLSIRDFTKIAKSKYISKKEEESGNITYIYSEEHIKERNRKKAKKILKLAKNLKKLRGQLKKDLKDEDVVKRQLALAVSLMDETFERIGNVASATESNHFGVTTWKVKHIKFTDGKAKIKYVGKSGIKQEKEVKSKHILSVLKEQLKDKKPNADIFTDINANMVNEYLKPFKITAKDIRGLHANSEMEKALKKVHKKSTKDEKELKKEFKEALEITAKMVGHEPGTLKNQYLIPSMEKDFVSSGTISSTYSRN